MPITLSKEIKEYEGGIPSGYVICFDGSAYIDGKKVFPSYADRIEAAKEAGEITSDGRPVCRRCPNSEETSGRGFGFEIDDENAPDILFCKRMGYPCDQIEKCIAWNKEPVVD